MTKTSAAIALGGAFLVSAFAATGASAQSMMGAPNGSEITGHSVQIDTNGARNTVFFDPGGTARITTPGGTQVQGNWFVQNQQLCLTTGSARECWPYQAAFQTGQPVALTSDCSATSNWTALSTAQPQMPPMEPPPERKGERG